MDPTQAGFLNFIRTVMNISTTVLPDDSWAIAWAYNQAITFANQQMQCLAIPTAPGGPTVYAQAVYNLAGDILINVANDQPGAAPVQRSVPPLPFFQYSRKTYNINSFVSGVIQSASDNGTSDSFVVPKALEGLTIANLQMLKTPWGRTYLGLTQSMGPTVVGIS